jgi:hypothetical protein
MKDFDAPSLSKAENLFFGKDDSPLFKSLKSAG